MNIGKLTEQYRYGNDKLLSASEQIGFLSAALIAASPIWAINKTTQLLTKITVLLLIFSIFCAIITHFIVGYVYIKQTQKIMMGKSDKNAYYIKSAIITTVFQVVFLFSSISLIVLLYLQ